MTWANILESVSVIVAAITVIIGVTAWRREYVGKRRIELAEEVLALFYEAQDAVAHMRSIFGYVGEGNTRKASANESPEEKEVNDKAYVVVERYNKHHELFNKLYSMRYRYMAQFGKDSAKPFLDLQHVVNDILMSSQMLAFYWLRLERTQRLGDSNEYQQRLEKIREYEAIFWQTTADGDPITQRVNALISDVDKRFRVFIEGRSIMSVQKSKAKVAWATLTSCISYVIMSLIVVPLLVGVVSYVIRYIQSLVPVSTAAAGTPSIMTPSVTSPIDLAALAATIGGLILVGAFYKEKVDGEATATLSRDLKRVATLLLTAAVSFTGMFLLLQYASTITSNPLRLGDWLVVYATDVLIAFAGLSLVVGLAWLMLLIPKLWNSGSVEKPKPEAK